MQPDFLRQKDDMDINTKILSKTISENERVNTGPSIVHDSRQARANAPVATYSLHHQIIVVYNLATIFKANKMRALS